MGRRLRNPENPDPFFGLRYDPAIQADRGRADSPDAASVWFTFEALKNLVRPEASREYFEASRPVAWKTGTSMGGRDAWAIGITPRYAVGVWVGNADGEGRPGINGLKAAAPLLFDIIRRLPEERADEKEWFDMPLDGMKLEHICTVSGYKAGPDCPSEDRLIPRKGESSEICPYHRIIHLDAEGLHQVDSRTTPVREMQHKSWFVLPPVQEYYYRQIHNSYKPLPPFAGEDEPDQKISFIYPSSKDSVVKIPLLLGGETGEIVFEAAPRDSQRMLYWHLDNEYIGYTRYSHQMGIHAEAGDHTVTVVDEKGNSGERRFTLSD